MPAAIAVPARRRHDISDRVMEFSSAPCQLYCIYCIAEIVLFDRRVTWA